jgi:hypothetical protein
MTSESVLTRWSRRKLASVRDSETSPARASSEPSAANSDPPEANTPATPAFDPASLPSIDSITASTDIRSFLQAGVPTALTRSALRRAWVTDPAIRDFVGIAESQWDFNDSAAMPGFGQLRADQVARLAERLLGCVDDPIERRAQAFAPPSREAIEEKPIVEQRDGPAGGGDAQH